MIDKILQESIDSFKKTGPYKKDKRIKDCIDAIATILKNNNQTNTEKIIKEIRHELEVTIKIFHYYEKILEPVYIALIKAKISYFRENCKTNFFDDSDIISLLESGKPQKADHALETMLAAVLNEQKQAMILNILITAVDAFINNNPLYNPENPIKSCIDKIVQIINNNNTINKMFPTTNNKNTEKTIKEITEELNKLTTISPHYETLLMPIYVALVQAELDNFRNYFRIDFDASEVERFLRANQPKKARQALEKITADILEASKAGLTRRRYNFKPYFELFKNPEEKKLLELLKLYRAYKEKLDAKFKSKQEQDPQPQLQPSIANPVIALINIYHELPESQNELDSVFISKLESELRSELAYKLDALNKLTLADLKTTRESKLTSKFKSKLFALNTLTLADLKAAYEDELKFEFESKLGDLDKQIFSADLKANLEDQLKSEFESKLETLKKLTITELKALRERQLKSEFESKLEALKKLTPTDLIDFKAARETELKFDLNDLLKNKEAKEKAKKEAAAILLSKREAKLTSELAILRKLTLEPDLKDLQAKRIAGLQSELDDLLKYKKAKAASPSKSTTEHQPTFESKYETVGQTSLLHQLVDKKIPEKVEPTDIDFKSKMIIKELQLSFWDIGRSCPLVNINLSSNLTVMIICFPARMTQEEKNKFEKLYDMIEKDGRFNNIPKIFVATKIDIFPAEKRNSKEIVKNCLVTSYVNRLIDDFPRKNFIAMKKEAQIAETLRMEKKAFQDLETMYFIETSAVNYTGVSEIMDTVIDLTTIMLEEKNAQEEEEAKITTIEKFSKTVFGNRQ